MFASRVLRTICALLTCSAVVAQRSNAQSGQYGEVAFANSGAAAAQPGFLRGLAQLHNFQYFEAADAFREAQRIDPSFAMAYWGEAMTYNHGVWLEQDSTAARAVIGRLAALPNARTTVRERGFIDALKTLYAPGKAKESRDTAYALAMQRLATRDTNDVEAQLFYSLALLSLFPRTDSTYMKAGAIAERVMRSHPNHPGALHYVIHAYDDPAHARQGLAAARAYSTVAADASHAQHMTSHIFIALGMWDDVVAANEVSTRMGRGAPCGHAAIWLHYAYLQQGRFADATKMEDICYDAAARAPVSASGYVEMRLQSIVDADQPSDTIVRRALSFAEPSVMTFAQQYGTAYHILRGRDTTHIGVLLDSIAQTRQALDTSPMARQMPGMRSELDVVVGELRSMLLLRSGKPDEAIRLMQQTAARDDAIPFEFGPPDIEKPTHELLGEMLLAQGRAAEAQRELETAVKRTPGRSMTLLDLAHASRAAGDTATANRASAQLRANWHRADPSVTQAGQSSFVEGEASALTREQLIAVSVLPLPERFRAGAGVVTFDAAQRLVELRKSSNGMICARFNEAPWDARCYHETFAPAFFRSRVLRARVAPNDATRQIEAEIKAGKLKVPTVPTAGYRMLGPASAYDVTTGRMTADMRVWQSIHMPFRTAQQIGLPDEQDLTEAQRDSTPFVMGGGTWWAHVMILHPRADSPAR